MDRRSSSDDRTSRHVPNPNVFDDEYAVDPTEDDFMPAVSDGFRPANASDHRAGDRQDHDRDEPSPPRPSISTSKSADSADLRRIASRNSTMKMPGAIDAASHDTRPPNMHARAPSSQTVAQHRMSISSTGSFATMARSESPFGAGPSHPYGMYPQNTMARTSSVTTSSTRQPHRSMSLQRPTHPYGMYAQNVTEDEVEPAMPTVQTAIPVGFPGINTGFHRQIGPDGEEQDIIGPDGHTEQLPPYSRYPEEGPTKAAMAAEASATPVTATPVLLPLSTSDETLIPPQPQQSQPASPDTHARAVPLTTVASTTTSEPSLSEKNEGAGGAGGWRKKRLWGKVPMGVVVILLVLVLVFAIILGAAIGTFVAKQNQKDHSSPKDKNKGGQDPAAQVTGASTGTLFDATPMATPTSLGVLPTGVFALPLGIAQESNPGCLPQANQVSAWSCKMGFAPLIFTINGTASGASDASMTGFVKADTGPSYGIQPPMLPPIQLELVLDLDYPAYGPAWHFQSLYDKLVVLTSDEFTAGAGLRRRDQGKPGFRQRFQVLPGDTPWYCYWNQTFIEGYIYVNDDSSAATRTAAPSWLSSNPTAAPSSTDSGGSSTAASPTTTPAARHRRGDTDYPHYSAYPRIVKIEERRLPGAPQPYCIKMQLLDNNAIVPATDSSGHNIVVNLQEQDPTIAQFLSAGNPAPAISTSSPSGNTTRRSAQKRDDPALACHCQWMFQ